jgi:transcription antitermination protein NusB
VPEVARGRRQARERALSLLYEAESKGVAPAAVLAGLPVEPAAYAAELVAGVGGHIDELDTWIGDYAKDWTVERMPALDRALLRMAVYELLHRRDVPTGAVISDAVELAQRFSTDESSRFVNGMLARIADAVRPSHAEAVDAEAVAADTAVDDEPAPQEMVEDPLHQ